MPLLKWAAWFMIFVNFGGGIANVTLFAFTGEFFSLGAGLFSLLVGIFLIWINPDISKWRRARGVECESCVALIKDYHYTKDTLVKIHSEHEVRKKLYETPFYELGYTAGKSGHEYNPCPKEGTYDDLQEYILGVQDGLADYHREREGLLERVAQNSITDPTP
jgi:hypothetical protein